MTAPSTKTSITILIASASLAIAAFAAPGIAQSPGLSLISGLQKGEWTITFRDGRPSRRLCLRDGADLVQLQHAGENCSRFVIEDNPTEVTVQYTCRGNGYGRTTIRRETGALIQIESQGIANGQPFELSAEGRRTASC